MQVLKIVLVTLVVSVLVLGVAAAGVVYSGTYNVAATAKHWPITHWVLEQTLHRSIEQHAAGIEAPKLGSKEQLLAGAANFDAMCSGCHAPPGAKPSVAAQGMYPEPPNLAHAGEEMAANEIYWILKHGLKASGMPAWRGSHGDDELWAMTAFVKQWPDMSSDDYDRMLASAEASGIGHHDGHDDGHDGGGGHQDGHDDDHGDAGHGEDPAGAAEEREGSHDDFRTHDDANAHG